MLAAAILAAGESRRMGRPKALVPYHGHTFLEYWLELTRHLRIGIRRVVLGAHAQEILAQISLDPASVVLNPEWESGQLSSIQAAVRSLPLGPTEGLLVCPVDHPRISAAVVAALIEAFDASPRPIVLPTYKAKRGHPVIFRSELYNELLSAPAEVGARAVVWAHREEIQEVPTSEEGVVLNINDREELRRALKATE